MSQRFEIEFQGEPGPALRAAFPEFELLPQQGKTLLQGEFVDQAALLGVIERIGSLGLEIRALRLVSDDGSPIEADVPDNPTNQRSA